MNHKVSMLFVLLSSIILPMTVMISTMGLISTSTLISLY